MISAQIARLITDAGLDPDYVERVVRNALEEDLDGGEDVTTAATVDETARAVADFTSRADGVAAGVPVAAAVLDLVCDGSARIEFHVADGDRVEPGTVLFTAAGRVRDLLTAERTALNLLCHLSGIATVTRAWVDAVAGTGARIRDTRKTTPGLRGLEKYAVRCGGGVNHRMSLSDAAMVKDNHVVAAGGVVEAFEAVRKRYPHLPIEVEVDTLDQLLPVVEAGAELVLLDNFTPERMRAAVLLVGRNEPYGRTRLEASGGLTLSQARAAAETGVDYLSVGALTHSAPILDVGCDFRSG
ncbi:carboxylating nicotinate-nucleotide diphosphorylase [Actinocrinis puniceicyclus]|uniref:Nicotinate-nucleotide pyrophosphorylase [carboxylating] n=1 Tax=Actinocrinis puniceicyclus TaxID=977794 RepID=A0A8J7WTB6_9ACTN|nr:carboxylating nicotinate-nucleotide diphosphorylase [Actinocrinis puniceicyclus]MBS2966102.1 carboxylating nicotinate-nucleotide diphosphorylase [Actinocrinis puniceicyclus]